MANITRFSPFRDLERFSPFQELEQAWKNLRMRPSLMSDMESFGDIRLDVSEDEKTYTVKADMPGVAKDDIKVSIDGNTVSITAEVRRESEDQSQGRNALCRERFYGQQYRSFALDCPVDDTQAEAKYENGVLELRLPKKPGATGHQIKVH